MAYKRTLILLFISSIAAALPILVDILIDLNEKVNTTLRKPIPLLVSNKIFTQIGYKSIANSLFEILVSGEDSLPPIAHMPKHICLVHNSL